MEAYNFGVNNARLSEPRPFVKVRQGGKFAEQI